MHLTIDHRLIPQAAEQAAREEAAYGPGTDKRLHAYRWLLGRHDWSYEYSDDPSAYRNGRAERAELERLARELDPQRVVWNELAPNGYKEAP